jgi:hypothetical protein
MNCILLLGSSQLLGGFQIRNFLLFNKLSSFHILYTAVTGCAGLRYLIAVDVVEIRRCDDIYLFYEVFYKNKLTKGMPIYCATFPRLALLLFYIP